MKIFDTDIQRLGRQLLPSILRKERIYALLAALIAPLVALKDLFLKSRSGNLYRLSITPQVFSLEKMLNDRYDGLLRRIYITAGRFRRSKFIYTQAEQKPLFIRTKEEMPQTIIYNSSGETGFVEQSFIIHIPAGMSLNEAEVRSMVDTYKLVTRSFTIIRF